MKDGKKYPLLDVAAQRFPQYTREQLISFIYCREISADGERHPDPRHLVDAHAKIIILEKRYVSRGGDKLAHALETWRIHVEGLVCIDAGASTGGFTDCLLQHGVSQVYAVDVGYNQLAWKLRTDPRVKVCERTNIMDFSRMADAAVADLSFRSIRKAAGHVLSLTRMKWMIALIKPQFEVQPHDAFDGVLRDEDLVSRVLSEVRSDLAYEGVHVDKLIPSPILGRKGNREYLALLTVR